MVWWYDHRPDRTPARYDASMTIKLESLTRPSTHELVVDRLRQEIYEGRLRAGDRLPGERQLSEMLDVSRPSVREALRVLQAQEILESHPGTGPRSGLIVAANPGRALRDLVSIHVALHSYSSDDITQARLAIEERALRLLCAEEDHSRLDAVEQIVDAMRQPDLTPELFHSLDTDFHLSLVAATGSNLLHDFMVALREAVRARLLTHYAERPDWPDYVLRLYEEHRSILEKVRARDLDGAVEEIRFHLSAAGSRVGLADEEDQEG